MEILVTGNLDRQKKYNEIKFLVMILDKVDI